MTPENETATAEQFAFYAGRLQEAIEMNCRGLAIPSKLAEQCPLHAKLLENNRKLIETLRALAEETNQP
jgi:hypothetical protein